jgi:hypothetical protein
MWYMEVGARGGRCPSFDVTIGRTTKNIENKSYCGLRQIWRVDLVHNNQQKTGDSSIGC